MLLTQEIRKKNEEFRTFALETLSKLDKTTDKNGNYLPMKLMFYNGGESWICYYPMFHDHIIICEISGVSRQKFHKILSNKESTIKYIQRLGDIIYVGLYEYHDNPDIITEIL